MASNSQSPCGSASSLAQLVDALRRSTRFRARQREWNGSEIVTIPEHASAKRSFHSFGGGAPALQLENVTPAEEFAALERLARRFEGRLFSFETQELEGATAPALGEALAPAPDGRACVRILRGSRRHFGCTLSAGAFAFRAGTLG